MTRRFVCALIAAAPCLAQQQPGKMDHLEHRFDNPEELAKRFDDPERDRWQMPERVIAELALKAGDRVADIGAGTGYFAVRLARSAAHPKVFGSDIEPSMVTYLKDRAKREGLNNILPVLASAKSPNLPEPVDVILVVDTYHHIGDRAAYFRQLKKSLRPGGRVAIIDFKEDSPEGPPKEFRFSFEQFRREMAEVGYQMTAHHDFLPRQQFMVFEVAPPGGQR